MELPTNIPLDTDFLFQAGFVLFVIKEAWLSLKGRDREYELALRNNTLALVELRTTMKHLTEKMGDISDRVKVLEEKL